MTGLLRGVVVAVLVGGATVVLSSCSGDPGPMVTLTSSPTATAVATTPSPSAAPSVPSEEELLAQIPENARREDFMSASNFAKFFVREYRRMLAERDPSLFSVLSEPGCVFCESALQTYADTAALGRSIEGGEITIDAALAQGGIQVDGSMIATIRVSTAAQTSRDASGDVLEQVPARSGLVSVQMHRVEGHWAVIDVNLQPDMSN